MVKIPEYMAIGRAIASYDLPETRISAGGAAAYARVAGPREPGALRARAARGSPAAADDGGGGAQARQGALLAALVEGAAGRL